MSDVLENIKKLSKFSEELWGKYFLHKGVSPSQIEIQERALGLNISKLYKLFLTHFNGGMLLEFDQTYYIDMTDWEPDGPKSSSFYFYSLEEVIEKYATFQLSNWMFPFDIKELYPIIPFCRTPLGQILFLVSQKGLEGESPVFMADEFYNDNDCLRVADDFNHFLNLYVENEGFPILKRSLEKPSWKQFLEDTKLIEIANSKESYDEIIIRTTAAIELNPKDEWYYCTRGNAYQYSGQTKKALMDFNSAIKLDESEAFFYHCRGDLLLNHGSIRASLIDLDIAVQLDPSNKMFLAGRAQALYKLNKLKKALEDCNTVLEQEPRYYLALSTRYHIYKAIGDDEKADADQAVLTDLQN